MENKKIRNSILFSLLIMLGLTQACQEKQGKEGVDFIFPKGAQGSAETFTGQVWNFGLVPSDSTLTTVVGNVYFEPGARSHWHSHPAGQILIITDGEGFHQIEGQPKQTLKKGDVVTCPPNVLHWHGASPETGMLQLYIIPNTEKGIVEWKHAVSEEEYLSN